MKQQVIPIIGGLELVTDKLSVGAGTAQYCLNYEVAQQRGISRIDGFSRWDGRRNFSTADIALYATADQVDASATGWTLGATVTVSYTDTQGNAQTVGAVVLAVDNSVDDPDGGGVGIPTYIHSVTVVLAGVPVNFPPEADVDDGVTDISGYGYNGSLVVSQVAAPTVGSYYSALVTDLPGNDKTRIPGLHFFADKLYAVVDLAAIEVTPVEGQLLEGESLYCSSQAAAFGTIALTRSAATAGNTIVELFDYTPAATLSGTLYTAVTTDDLLAPNGVFASSSSWTAGAGWAIGAGVAAATAAAGTTLTNALFAVPGFAYEIVYTVTAYTSGSVTVSFGGATGTARSATGTYTETLITTSNAVLTFTAANPSTLSIDNVTVKVVATTVIPNGTFASGANWTTGSGWIISSGAAIAVASSGALTSSLAAIVGRKYRVTYTVVRTAGSVQLTFGGASGTSRALSGTYVDYITASTTGALVFTGTSFSGSIDNVEVVHVAAAGTYVGTAEPTRAALYSADWDSAGGWTRLDLGRVVQYDEAPTSDTGANGAFFLPYAPAGFVSEVDADEIEDTGWVGANDTSFDGGGLDWNPASGVTDLEDNDNVLVSSTANATGGGYYTALLSAGFAAGTLEIPAGALIRGIEVSIWRYASHPFRCKDRTISVATATEFGTNKANTGIFVPEVLGAPAPVSYATEATYGEDNDLWQLAIKPGDLNDGSFRVLVAYDISGGVPNANMVLDQVRVKVHYQRQTRKAYVYSATNTPTDQEIEVVHVTVAEGTATSGTGTRKGLLILNSATTPPDNQKPWQFSPGMEIYTQTGGSGGVGVVMARITSDDEPITLPSSYALADEGSRYQFSDARPYARDNADVFFVCSGVEYANMFADGYLLPIQTGLLEQFEKPRHAMWAGNYLALGYATGTLSISDLGDPLTYLSAASTAAEIGASDRVTGLVKLKGNSLGVLTERTIFALQGSTVGEITRIDISPSSGAIEYTVCDGPTGAPMFCDYRGIATIETTDRYGDFDRPGIGSEASPWLIERLQSDRRNQTVDRTVIAAYPVRAKRQYRLLFNDGWQATLTVQPDGSGVITTQRLYGDWQDRDTSAIRVLGLTTGVTSTGQDLAFMSFDSDPESSRYRYAFQIDAGRSFDGEEIIAQWMGQPLILGGPFFRKTLYQFGLYGRAYGYADLKVFKASEFTDPVSDETTSASDTGTDLAFGTTASSTEGNYKAIVPMRGEGEDFTFLIESITATELPHTIQAMVVRFDTEEPHR